MAIALREGRLSPELQGYTDDAAGAVVAFGASAISALPEGFAQNIVETGAYTRAVNSVAFRCRRRAFRGEDKMRGAVIERLMCDMEVDLDDIRKQYALDRGDFRDEMTRFAALRKKGVCKLEGSRVRVPEEARLALRVVCSRIRRLSRLRMLNSGTLPQSSLRDRCLNFRERVIIFTL